jgi:xanthine dehydrogenase accessory factor
VADPILSLAQAVREKHSAVMATVVDVSGASPAKVGAQMVLLADGSTIGTVGGGSLEAAVRTEAERALIDGKARLVHYALTEQGPDAVGTLCGGDVQVFLRPHLPPPQLVIVGGGHIGRPLEAMGQIVNFDVVVVDVEPGRATVPGLHDVRLTEDSYVVLITTDHVSDEAALREALRSPVRYIGMIGSRSKCNTILDHLRADGYSEDDFARIYAPIGLDLGGPTPEEIALAILAEVVAVRRGQGSPGHRQVRSQGCLGEHFEKQSEEAWR